MGITTSVQRHAVKIRWISIAVIAAAFFVLVRQLPLDEGVKALGAWIEGLGWVGPVVFAGIYVVATVLLMPASVLTLGAGAVFGLWLGTAVVSVASTTGAACALLIGRYLARDKVRKMAQRSTGFAAVDRALGEGGWKIVAMLRLSPAIPFNLQNYLYGLTPIGFWTCVLTSWVAMLPGTFMYVYLGYVAGAAVGGERERTAGEWALLAVGLLATVAVTIYITKLAKKKLNEQTGIEDTAGGEDEKEHDMQDAAQAHGDDSAPRRKSVSSVVVVALIAVLMGGAAVYAQLRPGVIRGIFGSLLGPARVTLKETYEVKADGPVFDHSAFDQLLKKYVDDAGWVDYAGLKGDSAALDGYIASLGQAPFDALGRDEKLALLVNAYNAFTLRLILDYYPIASIKDISSSKRWDAGRWNLAGKTYSLSDIEHEQIRPKFKEPRIHFALVCAAVGCPPLRNEAYTGVRIHEQLEDQTRYIHSHKTWVRYDERANRAYLTPLYKWYGGDFEQVTGSVLGFVGRYVPGVKVAMDAGKTPGVSWLDYDWSLNSVENRKAR